MKIMLSNKSNETHSSCTYKVNDGEKGEVVRNEREQRKKISKKKLKNKKSES